MRNQNPNLSIDTLLRPSQGHTEPLSSGNSVPGAVEGNPLLGRAASSRSPKSPTSPLSPRARGYSLRTSLLKRAADVQIPASGSPAEVVEANASADRSHLTFEENGKKSASSTVFSPPIEPKKQTFASAALPNYDVWVREVHRRGAFVKVKKALKEIHDFILRIKEIPPSKHGRQIQLEAGREIPLIDERTGRPYISNSIRSTRYNGWDFFPRQLFFQFSKMANFYFLLISILQLIPGLSTTGTYTTIIPLLFFVLISIAKEGYDDYRRYVLDKAENNQLTSVLRKHQPGGTMDVRILELSQGPMEWADVKWERVVVGDIIRLKRNDLVPADIVLLHSDGFNGMAYIDTMALDGETNLKAKQASPALTEISNTFRGLVECDVHITAEDPDPDLYNFDGRVVVNGKTLPLTTAEIVYRGSTLRNTSEAIGMVINTGEDCKIRMNANKSPRIKRPTMQATVNKIVIIIVIFVVCLAIYNTVAYEIWRSSTERKSWYLNGARVPFKAVLVGFIILFNTMIPLSLYVSLEIVKLGQLFLMADVEMYDPVSDTPMEARTTTINEELGQITHIFSDKTGTLTDNEMRFRKFSVAGYAFIHDFDVEREAKKDETSKERLKGKEKAVAKRSASFSKVVHEENVDARIGIGRSSSVASRWKSSARPLKGQQPEIRTEFLLRYLQHKPHSVFSRKARFFLLSLALCHTCLPEKQENGEIDFQAASPDELALVRAAQELGYMVIDRPAQSIILKTFPRGPGSAEVEEKYEILDVIEFTSKRKRMSIIVRFPNGSVCIFCKGADSVIASRLKHASLAIQKATEVEVRAERRKSLEAERALRRMSDYGSPRNSFARSSHSVRRKSFAVNRLSMQSSKLGPIRDGVDHWLNDREAEGTRTSVENRSAYATPRTSVALDRISFSQSETQEDSDAYDDMIDESIVLNESTIFERCFEHTNDFASEGLRTLLYAHRFLEADEYAQWKKEYHEATTSLVNRQALIDEAGDLIEQNLDLSGATAIEDKLQSGVPETIDKLRRANIKMWMLTGDKRETAVNIGHSCRLIKDFSQITILDSSENVELEQQIAATILSITSGIAHSVVVIDGQTLSDLESRGSNSSTLFLDLAVIADTVICCRASPAQKANLVREIRMRLKKSVTLAIGDGANDIAMIQEAHVGIGITGKEGMMAARSSDYSIAKFRFLQRLILVHGRWNYVRTGKYILGTFWKEMLFFLHQALYQRWTGYTGTSLFESISLSMFNTLFTSLCVILLGIFSQDLSSPTLLAIPELYTSGQKNGSFSIKLYLAWMFMAASDAMILFFLMLGLWAQAEFTVDNTEFAMGDLSFTAAVIVINIKLLILETHNKTIIPIVGLIITVAGWFLFNILLAVVYKPSNPEYYVHDGLTARFGRNLEWWIVLFVTFTAALLWEILVKSVKKAFWPSDIDIFQVLEKDEVLAKRFREGGVVDLENGEGDRREREVQELLDRPRVMDDSLGSGISYRKGGSDEEVDPRN